MTDVTKNINDTNKENNAIASTPKKRSYRDIPLLIFIVAFAVFIMLGCTLITDKNQAENMLYEEGINGVRTSDVVESVSDEGLTKNNNPEGERYELAMRTKNPIKSETLSDGKLKVWFEDGTVDVFGDAYNAFGLCIIDEDLESGTVPLNEKQAVDNALKHAEAGDGSTTISGWNYYCTSQTFSGYDVSNQTSAYDASTSAYVYFTFNISGGTWYVLRGSYSCGRSLSYGGTSTSLTTDSTYKFVIQGYAYTGKDDCDTVYATASITSPKLTLTPSSSATPAPTATVSANTSFAQSKTVTYYGYASYGIYYIKYWWYAGAQSSSQSSDTTYPANTSATVTKTSYGWSDMYAYATYSSKYTYATKTAHDLYIDNAPPTVTNITFWKNSACTTAISSAYSGTVYVKVAVADTENSSYRGSYSYVKSCSIKNNTQNKTFTATNKSYTTHVSSDSFVIELSGNNRAYANGEWQATITDAVGLSATSGKFTYSYTDWKAPEVVSYSATLTGSAITSPNGSWTNAPILASVTFKDQVGDTTSKEIRQAYVNSLQVDLKVNGVTDTMKYDPSSTTTNGVTKTINSSSTVENSIYYQKTTFTFPIPYDYDSIYSTSADNITALTVKDKAGNSSTVLMSNLINGLKASINRSIDTIAPQVTITPVSAVTASTTSSYSGNTGKDVAFSVNVWDAEPTADCDYYFESGKKYNNGSGLKTIKLFTDATRTTPLAFYCDNKYYSSGVYNIDYSSSTEMLNANRTFNIVIPYDTVTKGKFYVVAYDYCGNASDGSHRSTKTYTYNGYEVKRTYKTYLDTTAFETVVGGYYLNQDMNKTTSTNKSLSCLYYIHKDYYAPQIVVRRADTDEVIASTNGYGGTTLNYTFAWSKEYTDQTFYVDYYYGCSGGKGSYKIGTASAVTLATVSGYSSGGNSIQVTNGNPASTYPYSSTTGGAADNANVKYTTYASKTGVAVTPNAQGAKTYSIWFVNNEGYNTSTKAEIKITTQIDNVAPNATLKGFYAGEVTNQTQVNATPLYKETDLVSSSDWKNAVTSTGQGLWAVFELSDTYSGIVGGKASSAIDTVGSNTGAMNKYYGMDGKYVYKDGKKVEGIQSSTSYNAGYKNGIISGTDTSTTSTYVIAFKYGSYTYKEYGYARQIDGMDGKYYAVVQMFSLDKLKEKCPTFCQAKDINGKTRDVWDIQTGTFLDYTFAIRDFLGNSFTYCSSAVYGDATLSSGLTSGTQKTNSGSYVLRYYVDPFPVSATVAFYTVPKANYENVKNLANASAALASGNNVKKFLRTDPDSGEEIWAVYDMCNDTHGTASWTKDYVIAEITKINSLSQSTIRWGQVDFTGGKSETTTVPYNQTQTVKKSDTLEWIVFISEESKHVKFALEITNETYSTDNVAATNRLEVDRKDTNTDPYYMFIKQDVTPPQISKVFFSDKDNLTSYNEALLAFDAQCVNGNYSFILDKEHSSAYSAKQSDLFVWSTKKVYAYFIVTDTVNGLTGSGAGNGIDGTNGLTLKINGVDKYCTPISHDKGDTMYIFRDQTWGCTSKAQQIGFSFTIVDAMGNPNTGTYSGNGKLVSGGNNVFRLFPIVDGVTVISELTSTSPAYTKSVSSPIGMVNALTGTATQNSSITLNINYTTGISGVKYYLKEVAYGTPFSDDELYAYNRGESLPVGYDIAANGWGHYQNGKFNVGAVAASRVAGDNEEASALANKTIQINISMTSLKKRLYLLAVSGTGTYYVLDLGDIFIDIEPVLFDPNMTIFTVESSASSTEEETYGEIAYANMQTIWTNVVGNTYTNGKVYIYYQLSDGASGIDDNTVLYNNNTKLEKILVTGIPVWHVGGEPTNIRIYDTNVPFPTANKSGEYVVVDGIPTNLLSSKVNSTAVTIGHIDEVYYRLLVTETGNYTIDAKDIAGNVWNANSSDIKQCGAKNTIYAIKIDSAPVKVQSTTYYASTNREYKGSLVDYTNDDVIMEWRVDYGSSGFGHLAYTITDNFQGIIDQYSAIISANLPKISISENNKFVLEYIGDNGKAQKYDTNTAKSNTVTVKAEAGYWKVNSTVTPIKVSTAYVQFGSGTYTIDYVNGLVTLSDSVSIGVARDIYNLIQVPIVHFDTNDKILLTYLDYNGDPVQINTNITKKANNTTEITTKIVNGIYYWAVNGTETQARVSAAPIYPNSVHDVKWTVKGSGTDAIIAITDSYDEVYAELRIPTVKYNENNKIVINYYDENNKFVDLHTTISKPSDSTVTITVKEVGTSLYWCVEGAQQSALVNTAYYGNYLKGKTWEVNTASNFLICSFVIGSSDMSITYSVRAYNNVSEEYAMGAEEKDITVSFVDDDKREVGEYESLTYNTSWNIAFGSQTLSYVDYEVIDDKGNLFTNRGIEVPAISFSERNTIIITYKEAEDKYQSYDTGISATNDTVTLKMSGSGQCVVDNRIAIAVNSTIYSTSLGHSWIYNLRTNEITLQDSGTTGLARNTFNSVLGSSVKVTVNGNSVSLTVGGVAQDSTVAIPANSSGIVELRTKQIEGTYYWHLNNVNTKIAVASSYPSNYYDVVWSWNAKNSSEYSIVDNIVYSSTRMRVPTLSNNNNKIMVTYLDDNGAPVSKPTLLAWNNEIKLTGKMDGTTRKWEVSTTTGGSETINMSTAYNTLLIGTTWEYNFATSSVKLTLPVTKNNAHVNYIVTAANDTPASGFNRPVSNYAESIVSIDVTAPIIDASVGNIAELNATDVWHALAKSLRVSVYDSMSGMGASTQACDVVNGVAIYYENAYIEIGYNKLWLVKCDDGLYRAYNGVSENINGVPIVRMTDLYYLDQYADYKLVVFDKAGNSSEYTIRPKVDTVTANVTNLTAYDDEGNRYVQGTPSVKWLQDTGISTINWADNYVYVTMNVTYGLSGYSLHVSGNYKKNVSGGLDATWVVLNNTNYEVIGTVDNNNGTFTDTVRYDIGKDTDYLYNYYMFRALTDAQNTELNVYKSYTNSSNPRAVETGNSAPDSTNYKLRVELESYEASDNGKSYAEIVIGKRAITELIAIDKTTPTVSVKAQDVTGADYGNRYNSDLVWEIPDGKWVNTSVTMIVTLGSASGYLSGNAFYYRSYAKDLSGTYKWSGWTMVLPTGRVYVQQDGKWTQQSGSSAGIFVEGKIRYYNNGVTNDETVTIANYSNLLKYTIESSTNNVVYEYYTETGAGKTSNHGTVGRIDGNNVYGVKIDTNTPNVSASGKATYDSFNGASAMDIQDRLQASYVNANNIPYVVTASASWTYYNSVVMGFAISNVGYSGITVMLDGEEFDVITYEEYLAESKALGSSSIYRYYYVGSNGETSKEVEVYTFAGTEGAGTKVYARIDNTTPIVYVSSINGTKATNWGWSADKNLYSDSVEYWYVSETEINLGVGMVEGNSFVNAQPYSGYEIEYQVNDSGDWLPVAGDVLRFSGIGDNVINGDIYKFRITSGAGLYYYIGAEIINNHIVKNNDISFHGQNIVNTIQSVVGSRPVQSHVIDGYVGSEVLNYASSISAYQMFVDANRYSYTYNGKVYLGSAYGYDINTNNFMSYSVKESDASGAFSTTIATQFHRGDVIELTYVAKHNVVTDDSYYGNGYNYFHDYTVGSPDGVERTYCATEEKTGSFKVQFVNDHINLVGYFIAEVRVNYGGNNVDGQDVFYKQTATGAMATTGEAYYVYSDGTTLKSVTLELGYEYFRYNEDTALSRNNSVGVDNPSEVGAYYVRTTEIGEGSFRITNKDSVNGATDYKDFVIKYFAKPVHVEERREDGSLIQRTATEIEEYYLINNVTDFYYVDNNYYNINSDGKVTTMPSTYLASDFILNADLEIDKRLEGTFTGTFNANGADNYGYKEITTVNTVENVTTVTREGYNEDIHTITILVDGVSNGKQSVFEKVDGIVKNLAIELSDVMTISINANTTTNVGLLASVVNGVVYNVSVTGDIVLDGVSTTAGKVNVGGLAGALDANAQLGMNSDLVYVDVRITNNGKVVNNANVSTLAGYVNNGVTFNNVQVFGEVTVYGVNNSVNIGTVYGDAAAGYYNASTMNYFGSNAFLNDYTVSGASSSSSAVTINGIQEVDYATMANNETIVAGKAIDDMIIARLYADFGYTYDGENVPYGIGTVDSPLIISTVEQLMAIDGYMNLDFVVSKNVKTLDMSDYDATVAIHKVFNGTFNTEDNEYVVFNNFAGSVDTFDGNYFGFFGQLNGSVSNIVFGDIAVDFTYEGSNALYAGLVAGKIYSDAVINDIVLIGTQNIASTNGAVYAGGIVGSASGGRIYDVFSMNNISVKGSQVVAGGIAGYVDGLYLYNGSENGAIYLLGRVEGNASSLVVGSAIGSGTLGANANNVYAIKNNTYNNGAVLESKPIGSTSEAYGINMVEFTDSGMRNSSFASGKNAFNLVFSGYYPLQGDGTTNSPFIVQSAQDFGYINIALYANYTITQSITFTEFDTIGEGLVFSGSINGSGGDNISAEESSIASLSGLDEPLVYNNTGNISNISLNIVYETTVAAGETFYFGAVSVYNSGTIKNVTVSGNVEITSEANDTTLYVSGFVGVNYGGDILLEGSGEEISKIQNSISALNITINGGGTAYVGGYAGVIDQGQPKFSYGLATGTITVTDVQTVYAGLFAGASYGECEWVLGEAASIDYTYTITVDGTTIPKTDENGDPIEDNFYGVEFIK